MAPRLADDRVGYFTSTRWDFGDDTRVDPRVHYINRWRLEKKDPAAALSEPKQPIVFWLDRNIPEKYRPAITEGVLIWNKAFEKQGFKDAVQVKVQPEDADWDTHDARHASLRWLTGTDIGFAIGPSQAKSGPGARAPTPARPCRPRPRRPSPSGTITTSAPTPRRPTRRWASPWTCWRPAARSCPAALRRTPTWPRCSRT
jgi:hypothetical protein